MVWLQIKDNRTLFIYWLIFFAFKLTWYLEFLEGTDGSYWLFFILALWRWPKMALLKNDAVYNDTKSSENSGYQIAPK